MYKNISQPLDSNSQLMRARNVLETQVRHGSTKRDNVQHLVDDLLQFDLPVPARYKHLDVLRILEDNCGRNGPGLGALLRGLSILERYGKNLLRSERPAQWRVVRLSNNIFKLEVDIVRGARDILKLLGYTTLVLDGLSYPEDILVPDVPMIASVTADILLLRQELIMLAHGEHKLEKDFYPYIPKTEIRAIQTAYQEKVKPSTPAAPATPEPSSSSNDISNMPGSLPNPPTYEAVLQGAGRKFDEPMLQEPASFQAVNHIGNSINNISNSGFKNVSVKEQQQPTEILDEELCDICGQKKSTIKCRKCDKIFCEGCDKIWHNNPKRRNHSRDIIENAAPPTRDVPESSMMNSLNNGYENRMPNGSMGSLGYSPQHGQIASQERAGLGNHSNQPTLSGERLRPTMYSRTSTLSEDTEWTRKVNRMATELMDIENPMAKREKLFQCLKDLDKEASKYQSGINQLLSKADKKPSLANHFQEKIDKIEDIKTQFKTLCGYEDPPPSSQSQEASMEVPIQSMEFGNFSNLPSEGGWSFKSSRSEVESNLDENVVASMQPASSGHRSSSTNSLPKISKPVVPVANLIDFSPEVTGAILINHSGFSYPSTNNGPLNLTSSQYGKGNERAISPIDETVIKSPGSGGDAQYFVQPMSTSAMEDPDLQSVFSIPPSTFEPLSHESLKRIFPNDQIGTTQPAKVNKSSPERKPYVPEIESGLHHMNIETTIPSKVVEPKKKSSELILNKKSPDSEEEDFHSAEEGDIPLKANIVGNRLEEPILSTSTVFLPNISPEDLRNRMKKEENRFQTTQFLDLIRAGDLEMFRPDQVQVAIKELEKEKNDMRFTPNSWLERNWKNHVMSFIVFVKEKGYKISAESAEDVLLEGEYNFEKAFELIVDAQHEKVRDLGEEFGFEAAQKAMSANKGDRYLARTSLQKDHLQDIYKEFIEKEADDEPDVVTFKRALEIDKNELLKNHAFVAIFDFKQVPRAETLNALLEILPDELLSTLLQDAIEAISSDNDMIDVDNAIRYLDNECMICTEKFPQSKITCLPTCGDNGCNYCRSCLEQHLAICVTDKNIRDIVCPVCSQPETNSDEETLLNFFSHVDAILRHMPDKKYHDIFLQKSRDFTLMRLPNFRWCSHCSGGFQYEYDAENNNLKMVCPFCRKGTCYKCKKNWESQHDGITCEQFQRWKEQNDPEFQAVGLARHLKENGIDCPDCNFRYALAKGGCMHFKCTQCSHEFCSGCASAFKNGKKCGKFPTCHSRGLHAHHPRDCLFYLRDYNPSQLQKLLRDNNIQYNTKGGNQKTCEVMEQKDTPDGLKDDACGRNVMNNCAGLCKLHYIEYLVNLVNIHRLDPADIFTVDELKTCLRREDIDIPQKKARESEDTYRKTLLAEVKKLPLKRQGENEDVEMDK
ncbi:uncharacterized protein LOC120337678 isoform X1 [Styela clava]